MSKNFFISFILVFFIFFHVSAEDKIAFIDLNYIYANSKIGKKIIKETQAKQKNLKKEFQDFQKKLDKEKEKLLAQKNVLSVSAFEIGCAMEKFKGPTTVYQSTPRPIEDLNSDLSKELS